MPVFIADPAQTDGSGKTGLVAANLTVSFTRVQTNNQVVVTDATSSLSDLAALTTAWSAWGLKEVSSTLAPGLYRLDIADAVFATGAWSAVVYVMITTSAAAPSPMEFVLSIAPGATGGLVTVGTGANNFKSDASANVTFANTSIATAAAVTTVNGLAAGVITAASIAADAITDAKVASDVTIASVTGAVGSVTGAVGSVTGNVGGNVTGTVGSVVGAVGSVTGNVGGNVTGTVGSVVGAVGSVTGLTVATILTTAITEAYRANGAAPTLAQFMSEALAHLGEAGISGTTKTIKKLDHSTTAETFTLDSATAPTSITRAT